MEAPVPVTFGFVFLPAKKIHHRGAEQVAMGQATLAQFRLYLRASVPLYY